MVARQLTLSEWKEEPFDRMEVASDGLDMDLLIVDASPVDSHVDVGRHLLTFWQSMDSRATLASAILTARGLGAWFDTSDRGASGASLVTRVVLLLVDMAAAVAVLSLRVRLAEERMAASLFEGLLFSVVGSGAAYWFLSAKTVLPNDMGRDEHAVDASSTMLAASSSLDTTLPRLAPAGVDDSEQEVDASSKSLHVIPAETTQLPIDVGFADERPLPGDLESTTETGSSRGEAADAGTGFHTPPRASTQTPMTELASHPLSPGVLDGREPMSPPGIGPSRLVFDGDEKTPKALRGLWPGPPGQPGRVVWEANNLRVVAMAIRHTGRPNAEVVEMSATVLEWSPGHVAWTAVGAPFETLVDPGVAEGSVSIDRKEQKEHGITAEILRQAKAPGPVAAFSLLSDWVESLCMSATALHVVAALAAGRTLRALARTAARGGMELPELLEDAPILEIGDLVTDHLQPKSSRRRRLLKDICKGWAVDPPHSASSAMDLIALKAILNAWCSAHSTSHLPGQESPSRRTERTRGFDLGESPSSTGKDSGRAGLGAHWPSPQDLEGLSPQEAVKALVACAVRPAAAMESRQPSPMDVKRTSENGQPYWPTDEESWTPPHKKSDQGVEPRRTSRIALLSPTRRSEHSRTSTAASEVLPMQ